MHTQKKQKRPTKKTDGGYFMADASNLWHYTNEKLGTIRDAIEDALKNLPKGKACWFWFNGTPAPINRGDKGLDLFQRWTEWREAYQAKDSEKFLGKLHSLTS